MKSLLCLALAGAATSAGAQPQSGNPRMAVVEVQTAASQPAATGAADRFSGAARITTPFSAPTPGRAGGGTVAFEAAARTAWHTHPLGQTLIVAQGVGLVQQQGQPARVMRVGDVVSIPAQVRHWHGAGPGGAMVHVAIAEKQDGQSVTWQELVSDGDYQAAWQAAGLQQAAATQPPTRHYPGADTLNAKQQAIPLIAAFAASSDMAQLDAALRQGLDAGLSISESQEVLVQLYAYVGFPKSLNALTQLMKVLEARQQQGIQDAAGAAPSAAVATGEDLVAVGRRNQTEISGGPVQAPVMAFAPVINQFLQAHLFGDIFERDNLDWQSRELATVGALAATVGAEAQLRSHMLASMRVGLRASQLQELIQLLAASGQTASAERAQVALSQALATKGKP
ncbi:carboxymuconolactone decarboxylase family protein [Comamonas piscis]|uniref:Carboxymuconolactone decarboxylase family protein n=1 Tax=Comamonas piscis TaxID=1562974 RepID=A0A7G5EFS3_9BURK|nr:carboxymuconolactone decarboxylase family protein [Comamonas piscis]QMV72848.1 carboxymuconolactone decarboxylase family protein [Comamonas piscis]WSO35625.1 carboxymuconolactone decarboxylase family protein [Comamonas piscis]